MILSRSTVIKGLLGEFTALPEVAYLRNGSSVKVKTGVL
jgi:hypothetical protein